MGTRFAVGPGAVGADRGFGFGYLTGEAADGVVRLGLQVRLAGRGVVTGCLVRVACLFVALAGGLPYRDPLVLGGRLERRDDCFELCDVVDH